MLLLNYDTSYTWAYISYYEELLKEEKLDIKIYRFDNKLSDMIWAKTILWKYKLIEINKTNPEIIDVRYILYLFEFENRILDMSAEYLVNYNNNKIPKFSLDRIDKDEKWWSLRRYKENIKLISYFRMFQEEGIVWNEDLMKYLSKIEKNKFWNYERFLLYHNKLFSIFDKCYRQHFVLENQEELKESMLEEYNIKFNKKEFDISNFKDFSNTYYFELEAIGLKVEEIIFLKIIEP